MVTLTDCNYYYHYYLGGYPLTPPGLKPAPSDYTTSRFDHRYKHRYHYPGKKTFHIYHYPGKKMDNFSS